MFLLGIEFVLAGYITTRVFEKIQDHKENVPKDRTDTTALVQSTELTLAVKTSEREKKLHYIKVSGAAIGFSALSYLKPIFLPVALLALTYSSIPYMRLVEKSIVEKKKVDGYVLYGIADLMTLGLGRLITASFGAGMVHVAGFIISNVQGRSKGELADDFSRQSDKAWLLKNGVEIEAPLEKIDKGDIVVVNIGDIIPVDGAIIHGTATIDQRTLTGESQPVEKTEGNPVFASTRIVAGGIQIRVDASGDETAVAKIMDILNHSVDFENKQLQGEKWADKWTWPVLALAFGSMPFLGPVQTVAILNAHIAQNIRVVAPLSTLNYLNLISKKGILIKDGQALEDLHDIDILLFNKTGLRPEMVELFTDLRKQRERQLAIVSDDPLQPTRELAEKLQVDTYFHDVLPADKAEIIRQLQAQGQKVCFVGDGLEDAMAMKSADISISLSGATSVGSDAAQIVLMDGTLAHLPQLLDIANRLSKNLNRGLLLNVAAGVFIVACVFVLRIGILPSMILNEFGLYTGLANAMLPLLTEKKKTIHS